MRRICIALLAAIALSGCNAIASKTNMLSDEKILSISAGALGYQPSDLKIVSRRVDGTNTYVNLEAANKKQFTCIINGGNALTFGMTNPPSCTAKR
jgi:hypothetical protein